MPGNPFALASSSSSGGKSGNPFAISYSGGGGGGSDNDILHRIERVFTQGAADFRDMALGLPAGLAGMVDTLGYALQGNVAPAKALGAATLKQFEQDITHPLRHPGYTLADLLPLASGGAGLAARAGEAGRLAELTTELGRKANLGDIPRVIEGPTGATATGQFSRSGLGFTAQKAIDQWLQKAQPGSSREVMLNKRINKWQDRRFRVERALAEAKSNRLWEAGLKLDDVQGQALRLVAEQNPLEGRLQADVNRLEEARGRKGNKPGVHHRTIKNLEDVDARNSAAVDRYLETDGEGRPIFKATPEAQHLAGVYGLMKDVVGQREDILKTLNLMDEAKLLAARERTGRFAMGAKYVEPTAARMGKTPRLAQADRRLKKIQNRYDRHVAKTQGLPDTYIREVARNKQEAITHLAQLVRERNKALRSVAEGMFGPVDKREVALRNTQRGKLKRQHARTQKSLKLRGFGTTKLVLPKTVWQERLAEAELRVQDILEAQPDHPVMKRWAERDDEINRLSEALNPDPEEVFGTGGSGPTVKLVDYRTLAQGGGRGGYVDKPGVYLRFGDLPEKGAPSWNHLAGKPEPGVSVYAAWKDPKTGKYVMPSGSEQYLMTQHEIAGRPIYEVRGREHPSELGDDGEPLLHPGSTSVVRRVHPDEVVGEQDPHLTLAGNEISDVPDWFAPEAKRGPDYGKKQIKVKRTKSKKTIYLEGALKEAQREQTRAAEIAAKRKVPVGVVGQEDYVAPEGGIHIGYQRPGQKAPSAQQRVSSTGTGGHTRDLTLRESKGKAIQYGLYEPNVAKILAVRGKGAAKLKMLARQVEEKRKGGTKVPTRPDDVFLWNDGDIVSQAKIDPEVKQFLTDPESLALDSEEADRSLADLVRQSLMKWPGNADANNWNLDPRYAQALQDAAEGKGVFVQRSLLGDLGRPGPQRIPVKAAKAADAVNNVQKSLLVYLKANYPVIQALSNTGMNMIQQGLAFPGNIVKAGELWNRDRQLAMDIGDVMGSGALMNVGFEGSGRIATATQWLAHFMSSKVDGPARLSAWIHEAEQEGFVGPKAWGELMREPENAEALGRVTQRAKEAIVDYGELGDTEQNVIRRIFFVYPWLKGSTKWTSHFLRDHPLQAGALGLTGQVGMARSQEQFPELPTYLRGAFRAPGWLPLVGGGLVNPSGVNQFQTPAQIGSTLAGLINRTPEAPTAGGMFTPALGLVLALATGRDTLGRPLPPGILQTLRQLEIAPAPA